MSDLDEKVLSVVASALIANGCSLPATDRGDGCAGPRWVDSDDGLDGFVPVSLDQIALMETLRALGDRTADMDTVVWTQWERYDGVGSNPHVQILWTWETEA